MNTDVIIVGQGLAGTVLAHTLSERGISVQVLNSATIPAQSMVAGGLYNPITGKRMTKTWMAKELFEYITPFYSSIERMLDIRILHPMPIYKPFANIEEQNTWMGQSADEEYSYFLEAEVAHDYYKRYVHNPLDGFATRHSGYVDVPLLLHAYRAYLKEHGRYTEDTFDYSGLHSEAGLFYYKDIAARYIIFAEGVSAKDHNPFFNMKGIVPSKGEVLTLEMNSDLRDIVNKQCFVIPLGQHRFRAGSTYQWTYKEESPSEWGLEDIRSRLNELLKSTYQVIKHEAGIRPSTKDRRPIIGQHPEMKGMYVFNGLGAKGVSLAPYFAEQVYRHIFENMPIQKEVDIKRFK